MSSSRHPIALRLERSVGDPTRLLATVMLLPLVDGIFPALVLAGALDTWAGVVQVGLLVFGGSATLAVVLAEMTGSRRDQVLTVLAVGVPLVLLAGLEAALAPTIAGVLNLETFARFAALVVGAIAAKTASARVGEYLPRPAVIVGLGFVASVDPTAAELVLSVDRTAVVHGVAAGLVGLGFALGVALLGPYLRANVAIDRFRFGSAVALGLLALTLVGFPFGRAPLAVIAVTALFTFDPDREPGSGAESVGGAEPGTEQPPASERARLAADGDGGTTPVGPAVAVSDGDGSVVGTSPPEPGDGEPVPGTDDSVAGDVDGDRPPWL
ncbi:MAG: DUF5794 domain-containing protein [Halobacteriales archaeon]